MWQKVECVVEVLGYCFNLLVCSLCVVYFYVIGLVYDNLNVYYVISLQEGVLLVCCECGFGLQIYFCDVSLLYLVEELVVLVKCVWLVGLVLVLLMFEQLELIVMLKEYDVYFVCIIVLCDDFKDGYFCVYVDDCDVVYVIIEYLIQFGYMCIGFLWGELYYCFSFECYQGYVDVLKDYGIVFNKKLVLLGCYVFDDGFCGVCKLFVLKELFIVIFGSNDEIVVGVLVVVCLIGLDVLWDLFIVGFEDNLFFKQVWLVLIIVCQFICEIVCYVVLCLMVELQYVESGDDMLLLVNEGFVFELVVCGFIVLLCGVMLGKCFG